MGKALKEFQLCDFRRLRKKAQDAQDNVIKLFDLFHARFWGWKGIEFGLLKAVLPSM